MKTELDAVAPIKTKKITRKNVVPWKNNHTMKLKRECRASERRWRKTKLDILTENLKSYDKEI